MSLTLAVTFSLPFPSSDCTVSSSSPLSTLSSSFCERNDKTWKYYIWFECRLLDGINKRMLAWSITPWSWLSIIRNILHQYIYCAEMCLKIFKFMETLTTSLGSLSHYSSIQIILTINVRCQRNRIKIQTLVITKPETASSALRLSVTFKTTHRTGSLPKNTLNSPSQVQ